MQIWNMLNIFHLGIIKIMQVLQIHIKTRSHILILIKDTVIYGQLEKHSMKWDWSKLYHKKVTPEPNEDSNVLENLCKI